MFTVDAALEHTGAELREQVARGQITAAEFDLLMDGAILLAIHLESLIQDARTGQEHSWAEHSVARPEFALPLSAA